MEYFTRWIGVPLFVGVAALMGSAASTASENEARSELPEPGIPVMNVNQWVIHYIACWNERDAVKRRRLVAQTWAAAGSYVDAHRNAKGQEAHSRFVRFSWGAGGTDEAPLYLGGTDFVTLGEDGRALSVVGFVDASPAAP
jgi:hypothetical protein